MILETWILPECNTDTLLIDIIGFKKPYHQSSIGDVANTMTKSYKNKLVIGVIDNDKRQPGYFGEFTSIKTEHQLILKHKPDTRHYLIVICPAIEKWIYYNAEKVNVNPQDYGFRTFKYFKAITKSINAKDNKGLKNLLNTIKQKKAPPLLMIKSWIENIIGS